MPVVLGYVFAVSPRESKVKASEFLKLYKKATNDQISKFIEMQKLHGISSINFNDHINVIGSDSDHDMSLPDSCKELFLLGCEVKFGNSKNAGNFNANDIGNVILTSFIKPQIDLIYDAELWVSAPCPVPIKQYSKTDLTFYPNERDSCNNSYSVDSNLNKILSKAHKRMTESGFLILKNCVTEKYCCDVLNNTVIPRIEDINKAIVRKHPEIEIGKSVFNFKEISSRGEQRFDLMVEMEGNNEYSDNLDLKSTGSTTASANNSNAGSNTTTPNLSKCSNHGSPVISPVISNSNCSSTKNPLTYYSENTALKLPADIDASFRPIIAKMLQIKESEMRCQVSIVYSRPGATPQAWHCDGRHLENDAVENENGVQTKPYAICAFMPLINLDEEVGYTEFWPGSHKYSKLLGFGPAAELMNCTMKGIIAAGDCVLYDYRTVHRGRANESEGTLRPQLQFLYMVPGYKEEKNYGEESLFSIDPVIKSESDTYFADVDSV